MGCKGVKIIKICFCDDIDVYTSFYQNIPYCWRSMSISLIWPRRCLGQWKLAFGKPIGQILWVSVCVRKKIIKEFLRLQKLWVFCKLSHFGLGLDLVNLNVHPKLTKISHMVEYLRRLPYFHFFFIFFFFFRRCLGQRKVAFGKRIS